MRMAARRLPQLALLVAALLAHPHPGCDAKKHKRKVPAHGRAGTARPAEPDVAVPGSVAGEVGEVAASGWGTGTGALVRRRLHRTHPSPPSNCASSPHAGGGARGAAVQLRAPGRCRGLTHPTCHLRPRGKATEYVRGPGAPWLHGDAS